MRERACHRTGETRQAKAHGPFANSSVPTQEQVVQVEIQRGCLSNCLASAPCVLMFILEPKSFLEVNGVLYCIVFCFIPHERLATLGRPKFLPLYPIFCDLGCSCDI